MDPKPISHSHTSQYANYIYRKPSAPNLSHPPLHHKHACTLHLLSFGTTQPMGRQMYKVNTITITSLWQHYCSACPLHPTLPCPLASRRKRSPLVHFFLFLTCCTYAGLFYRTPRHAPDQHSSARADQFRRACCSAPQKVSRDKMTKEKKKEPMSSTRGNRQMKISS